MNTAQRRDDDADQACGRMMRRIINRRDMPNHACEASWLTARHGEDACPINFRQIGRIVHRKTDNAGHEGVKADAEGGKHEI